ncbi:hypothetical protein KDN34_02990 [Shewanella yunxiaonensis]|uniref:Uncharacterized protein n=1 Tax=Shewanella yunxiaonensis TaxID=2829809 RepID=A0ABX7YUX4_9GAMM|nr:hypothetical protein [Shewanella yunxiaonensis]QUN06445.1 hypothetical protein KDN34_02990 [Shewanella yunxiaonensis]
MAILLIILSVLGLAFGVLYLRVTKLENQIQQCRSDITTLHGYWMNSRSGFKTQQK